MNALVAIRSSTRRAFSLTELMVVIAVIGVLAYIGLAAFPSMLRASDRTLAENQLRIGLSAARDAAIRGDGTDAAAVFTYDPVTRRTSIIPCVMVGTFRDRDPDPTNSNFPTQYLDRELFVPLSNVESPQLPSGWLIAGLASESALDNGPGNPTGWYVQSADRPLDVAKGAWVLPETDYYYSESDVLASGNATRYDRCTFMVRFAARTGVAISSESSPAAVLLPRPSTFSRPTVPTERSTRPDLADNLTQWGKRLLRRAYAQAPDGVETTGAIGVRRISDVLGSKRLDSVLASSVLSIAVMDTNELAKGLGIRANSRETGSIYSISTGNDNRIKWDDNAVGTANKADIAKHMDEWITGTLVPAGASGNKAVTSDVRIFVVQPIGGVPVPVTE